MSKKKGIIRLVVLLAVIAFVVYTAVSGLGSDRSGSLNDISLGLDLRGGVSITYEAVGDVNSQDMSDTKAKLEKRVHRHPHWCTSGSSAKSGSSQSYGNRGLSAH